MMLTTDLALRMDPIYGPIAKRFHENPDQLADAFAQGLVQAAAPRHGPASRATSARGSPEPQLWQDPVPAVDHELIGDADVAALKAQDPRRRACRSRSWSSTAWASAASFRGTDKRGGANGARIRLAPQKDWEVNEPAELAKVLQTLEQVQQDFNAQRRQAGLARRPDRARRVRGRRAGGEGRRRTTSRCRSRPGAPTPRRSRPTSSRSRCSSRRPTASATTSSAGEKLPPETLLLDRAYMLDADRARDDGARRRHARARTPTSAESTHGVFTDRPGTLTNDFFVNLLDMGTEWKASEPAENVYEGRDRATGEVKWTATAVDLVFGSHSQLRALAEVYASDDAKEKFVRDFVAAWDKVMNLDRFDLR